MGYVRNATLKVLADRKTSITYGELIQQVKVITASKYNWSNLVRDAATEDAGWAYDPKTQIFHPPKLGEEQMVDLNLVLKLPLSKVKEFFGTIA